MSIQHGTDGQRTIVGQRKDSFGRSYLVVSAGPHLGFVQREFVQDGRPYVRRTFLVNGRTFARVYAVYDYHGVPYYRYVPARFYAPGFYAWARGPWGPPVAYAWGWGPWYASYGYYFTPYPAYPSAWLWLTDYVISQNLERAYEAQSQTAGDSQPAPEADANSTSLTPELKQGIAEELKAQLDGEKDAVTSDQINPPPSSESIPAALDPNHRTFIVAAAMSEPLPDGMDCSLSPGDVLTRSEDTPDANQKVKVMVVSSQKNDCRSGMQLALAVTDLQEMHNFFRAELDEGLALLAESQGKNGIPAGPAPAPQTLAAGTAQPDLTVIADLQQQQEEADRNEKEVLAAARSAGNQ
jgi:hypothetical protein